MKYLFLQTFVSFLGAMFLLFLFMQKDFLPFDNQGLVSWYNVSAVLFFLFLFTQGLLSIVIFLFQKFLTCGIKEFPPFGKSLKWGLLISILLVFILILNLYNIINILWGAVILVLIILLLTLIKF